MAFGGYPNKQSYRSEKVVEISHWSRPLNSTETNWTVQNLDSHHGLVARTEIGNRWLIHHPGPNKKGVITDAKHMSPKWKHVHNVDFNGHVTVQDLFEGCGSDKGWYDVGFCTGYIARGERAVSGRSCDFNEHGTVDINIENDKFGTQFVGHNKVGYGTFGIVYEVKNEKGEKYGIKKSWIPGKLYIQSSP